MIIAGINNNGSHQPMFSFDDFDAANKFVKAYNKKAQSNSDKKQSLHKRWELFREEWVFSRAKESFKVEVDVSKLEAEIFELNKKFIEECKASKSHNTVVAEALKDKIAKLKKQVKDNKKTYEASFNSVVYEKAQEFKIEFFLETLTPDEIEIWKSEHKEHIQIISSDVVHNPPLENM